MVLYGPRNINVGKPMVVMMVIRKNDKKGIIIKISLLINCFFSKITKGIINDTKKTYCMPELDSKSIEYIKIAVLKSINIRQRAMVSFPLVLSEKQAIYKTVRAVVMKYAL